MKLLCGYLFNGYFPYQILKSLHLLFCYLIQSLLRRPPQSHICGKSQENMSSIRLTSNMSCYEALTHGLLFAYVSWLLGDTAVSWEVGEYLGDFHSQENENLDIHRCSLGVLYIIFKNQHFAKSLIIKYLF